MCLNANNEDAFLAVLCLGFKEVSRAADVNNSSGTRVTDIDIDREVPSWLVAEYTTRYADTSDARRSCAMFSDGADLFLFDRRNVRRDTDIGARSRR